MKFAYIFVLIHEVYAGFCSAIAKLKPKQRNPHIQEFGSKKAMRIIVRPGERTLLLLVTCFTLPTLLFAVTISFEPMTTLALAAAFLLHSYLFWVVLSVNIDLSDKDIRIKYFNHELQDNIDNLVPVASPKFDYRKDEQHALKKLHSGTRLLGFAVGWFTLKNNDVAFSCVTRKSKARFFSSKDGYLLILDPRVASKIELYMKS